MLEYSEIEKLHKSRNNIQIIHDFLEWAMKEKIMVLSSPDPSDPEGNTYIPNFEAKIKLVAEYFKIDLDKLDAERQALLGELRKKIN